MLVADQTEREEVSMGDDRVSRHISVSHAARGALLIAALASVAIWQTARPRDQGVLLSEEASSPEDLADASGETLETVTVTSSRATSLTPGSRRPTATVAGDPAPGGGRSRVAGSVDTLPPVLGAQGDGVSSASAAPAEVDPRGLSARASHASGAGQVAPRHGQPDLLAGAASMYGADAVSGLVNFVMSTHQEGINVAAAYGFYHHDSGNDDDSSAGGMPRAPFDGTSTGFTRDENVILGMSAPEDRDRASFYATYRDTVQRSLAGGTPKRRHMAGDL
jgi:hypothetical protein